MPLNKGCSQGAFDKNMHILIKEDKREQDQAVAIAINTLKGACGVESKKRMKVKDILTKGGKKEARMRHTAIFEKRNKESIHESKMHIKELKARIKRAKLKRAKQAHRKAKTLSAKTAANLAAKYWKNSIKKQRAEFKEALLMLKEDVALVRQQKKKKK